jgi:hypothetical protein
MGLQQQQQQQHTPIPRILGVWRIHSRHKKGTKYGNGHHYYIFYHSQGRSLAILAFVGSKFLSQA